MSNKIFPIISILLFGVIIGGALWMNSNQGKENSPQTAPADSINDTKVEVNINPNDPVKGNPEAKVTIAEFSDFQCPFCASVEPTLKKILETYPNDVKLIYKNFPLPSHQYAVDSALAVLCAKDQGKFWEYHDTLFNNQGSLAVEDLKRYAGDLSLNAQDFNACLESKKYATQIEVDKNEGNRLNITGTPAFFINGRFLSGAQPFEKFKAIIDDELSK